MNDALDIHPPDEALWSLAAAVCDGTITAEETARLESMLRESEAARLFYVAYMDLHGDLLWQGRDRTATLPEPAGGARTFRVRWYGLAAMAAAVFVGLVVAAFAVLRGTGPAPIGHLAGAVDCRWESDAGPAPGQALYPGQDLRLEGGVAEIALATGATVTLQQRARVRLASAGAIDLREGTLWAGVPEEAKGFTVRTPGAEVVDQGTEFGVLAEPAGATEVHVFRGRVDVTPQDGPQRRLEGDQAVRLEAGAVSAIAPDGARFAGTAAVPARIALADDFARLALDPQVWQTRLPYPDSQVEPVPGAVRLVNAACLVTAEEFDSLVSGRLRVTGTIRFPTFGPHVTWHEMNVVTRSDGRLRREGDVPGWAYHSAAGGIVYRLSTRHPYAEIMEAGSDFRISRRVVTGDFDVQHDAAYRFEIIDDGLRLSATMSEVGDPANRVTVTATVIKDTSDTNHVAFYGRERHKGRDIAVDLADLRITLGRSQEE
jgi:hypothetical protein